MTPKHIIIKLKKINGNNEKYLAATRDKMSNYTHA